LPEASAVAWQTLADAAWWLVPGGLLLGAVAGLLAGLLGVGGGVVLVPGLAWLLVRALPLDSDLAIKTAIGTSLAVICFSSLASVRSHAQRGAVRGRWVAMLTPGIALGCVAAASVAHRLPGTVIVAFFSSFLLLSAWRSWHRATMASGPAATEQAPAWPWAAVAGPSIGALAGLIGGGGAFISVPLMRRRGLPMHAAVGTAAALGVPIAVCGAVAYAVAGWTATQGSAWGLVGYIHLPALAVVALASVSCAPLGARWAHHTSRRRLEQVFALTQALIGAAWLLRTGANAFS
jgi:uncharacterized membrane protein YfcA